jgi:hypothetical protein
MKFVVTATNTAPVIVSTRLDAVRKALELKREGRDEIITGEQGREYGLLELDLFYFHTQS